MTDEKKFIGTIGLRDILPYQMEQGLKLEAAHENEPRHCCA